MYFHDQSASSLQTAAKMSFLLYKTLIFMRFKQFRTSQYSDESRGNQCDTSKYMGEILIVLIDSNYQGQLNLLPTHLLELPFQCCEKAIQSMLCFNPNLILTLLVESMDMTQQAGAVINLKGWPTNYHG